MKTRNEWPLRIEPRANGQQLHLLPDLLGACREWRRRRDRDRCLLGGALAVACGYLGVLAGLLVPWPAEWLGPFVGAVSGTLFGWWLGSSL